MVRPTVGIVFAADGFGRAIDIINNGAHIHKKKSERAHQSPPPTPMTVMGLQVRPTSTVRSWMTTPKRPKRPAAEASFAGTTELQHWTGPVEQEALRTGVAAARAETARVTRVASWNCMVG